MKFIISNPKLTLIARLLLGFFMFGSGVMTFFISVTNPEQVYVNLPPGELYNWTKAVIDTGYLFSWIGIFKICTGLCLFKKRTAPLGAIAAVPYYTNILLYTVFLANIYLPLSIFASTLTVFLIFQFKDHYKPLLQGGM